MVLHKSLIGKSLIDKPLNVKGKFIVSESSKRLDYIDIAKGIGIILVVLGHVTYIPEPARAWISTFHMPFFFVIAGVLMAIKNEVEAEYKELAIRKARGLLIPYLWFSLAYAVIDLVNIYIHNIDWKTYIYNQLSSVTLYGSGALWFLPALFLGELIFIFIYKKAGTTISALLMIVLPFISWGIEQGLSNAYAAVSDNLILVILINAIRVWLRAAIAAGFVGISYFVHRFMMNKFENYDSARSPRTIIINLVLGIFLLIALGFLTKYNTYADLNNMRLGNPFLYFLFAYMGSYGLLLLCRTLKGLRFIQYLGRNSLIIMAVHLNFYVIYIAIKIASYADVPIVKYFDTYTHPQWNELYVLTVIVVVAIVICIIPIEIINRWMPFVIGKKTSASNKK